MKVLIMTVFTVLFFVIASYAAEIPERLKDAIKVQVLLERANFSSGEIDGSIGSRTRKTIAAFQEVRGLKETGEADPETLSALDESSLPDILVSYTIQEEDVKGPFVDNIPRDKMEQSKLSFLGYTSPLEALAEKFHSSPGLLKKLNPNSNFAASEEIQVPNVFGERVSTATDTNSQSDQTQTEVSQTSKTASSPKKKGKNAENGIQIVVSAKESALTLQNGNGEILFYAPVTAGSEHDPLPLGQWKVTGVAENPDFNYNPELFWDADPSHSKAKIAKGPNNPVGVAWIDIDKEHYGIHGSPEPAKIGKTESYGCVRLTNWDIQKVLEFVKPGTKVIFQ